MALPYYKQVEAVTEAVIFQAIGLAPMGEATHAMVKHFDERALMTERRDLVTHCNHDWSIKAEPFCNPIYAMSPADSARWFLGCFSALRAKVELSAASLLSEAPATP